jgi:type II restriction enzyme
MMDLHFNQSLATGYHSSSQISRVLTEDWMARNMFCPVCGAPVLGHYKANKPVADFFCDNCKSDFELKSKESKKAVIGHKIADGAYGTMIERITSLNNPHLFVMTYANWTVNNLLIIPKFFFVPNIIEKRKPLADTAQRAGWVGCNIEIGEIPENGKIFIVRDSRQEAKSSVVEQYQRTLSLQTTRIETRGWLLDVLKCVERIPNDEFNLDEVYAFANELKLKHPDNNFIHDKIRQQLQYLRDKGFVQFINRGKYRKLR